MDAPPAPPPPMAKYVPAVAPVILVAVGYMDPGNWASAIESGSRFGFELLWVVILANVMAALFQTLATRLGLVSGKHLAEICREDYPRPVCLLLWLLSEVSIIALDLTIVVGTAVGLNLLFGFSILPSVLVLAFDGIILRVVLSMVGVHRAELVAGSVVGVVLVCFGLGTLLSRPSSTAVIGGLWPKVRGDSLYTAVGLLGANVVPHTFYLHSAILQRQHNLPGKSKDIVCQENVRDIIGAFGIALLANVAVLVVAASTFHNVGLVILTLQDAHALMEQILSDSIAPAAFGLALLCAGQLSALTGTLTGKVTMEGFLAMSMQPWLHRSLVRCAAVIPAAFCAWHYGSEGLYRLLLFSQIIIAAELPFSAVPLIKASSSEARMGSYRISSLVETVAWLSVALVVVANIWLVFDLMLEEIDGFSGFAAHLESLLGTDSFGHYGEDTLNTSLFALVLVAIGLCVGFLVWLVVTPLRVDRIVMERKWVEEYELFERNEVMRGNQVEDRLGVLENNIVYPPGPAISDHDTDPEVDLGRGKLVTWTPTVSTSSSDIVDISSVAVEVVAASSSPEAPPAPPPPPDALSLDSAPDPPSSVVEEKKDPAPEEIKDMVAPQGVVVLTEPEIAGTIETFLKLDASSSAQDPEVPKVTARRQVPLGGDDAESKHLVGVRPLKEDGNLLNSKHSIFLSHSGAQKSFVEQLCLDIERRDRYPFFDKRRDSLPIGEDFPKLIFEAIDQCQVGVVVLSEEFFSRSKWPMLELGAMVKRKGCDPKFIIMPVFLGVSHAQCRDKVNGERWLRIWQGWARSDDRIKVKEWQEAMRVFGHTNGISLSDGLGEVKCREEIVDAVCKSVGPNTRWNDSHVQGRSRLSLLIHAKVEAVEVSKSYGARVLGIYGVGGMGKTTLCKVLCNEFFEEFEGRVCHIEFGEGSMLQMVQEVLKRLTNTRPKLINSFSIGECIDRLKHELKKKVLLAIDNVSATQETMGNAKELLRLGFGDGSIIIVTARSLLPLQNLNLEDCIQMPELEEEDARSLFLYYAAPGMYLKNVGGTNEQVIKRCIRRCYFYKGYGRNYHYHPLALKVLGGQLGNKVDEWMAKLDLYKADPFNQYEEEEKNHPIFSILERSFELLKYEDQLLFMDVATYLPNFYVTGLNFEWLCMVHGKSIGEIMRRLEGLKSKSLVEDLGNGRKRIAIHDLWLEFVGMKAKGRGFDERPWIIEKVYGLNDPRRKESVLCGGGWNNLQRICMVGDWGSKCVVKGLSLSQSSNLRVLKLVIIGEIETQVLDLRTLMQLKSLQIHGCNGLEVYFLGLGHLKNLGCLHLNKICTDSTLLQEEIARLTNLQVLHVWYLSDKVESGRLTSKHQETGIGQKLGGEGRSTGDATGVTLNRESGERGDLARVEQQTLAKESRKPISKDSPQVEEHVLTESGNVRSTFPDISRLILLRDVYFRDFEGVDMISGLNPNMTRLKRLNIRDCPSLRSCEGVGGLFALEELNLIGCKMLEEVPNLRGLKNLLQLRVSGCESINGVPGLGDLISLQVFEAMACAKLAELPDMRKLVNLQTLELRRCPLIKAMPGLSDLIGLESLFAEFVGLKGCHYAQKLKKLETVEIEGWGARGIPYLSELRSLKSLSICYAEGVDELAGVSNLTGLQELTIGFCCFKDVPCLNSWTALKRLHVWACNKLERLPDMHRLLRLERLEIRYCESLREWEGGQFGGAAGALLHVRILYLDVVATLTELPDLSRFPQLRELRVKRCEKLTSLTGSAPLTALEILSLEKCGVVRALRAQLDLSHLVSPSSFKLWRSGALRQFMAHEIGKLQAMCPGPDNSWTKLGHLQHMELESDK